MREAYRQHKHILQPLSTQHIFLLIGYICTDSAQFHFADVVHQVQRSLHFLVKTYLQDASTSSS